MPSCRPAATGTCGVGIAPRKFLAHEHVLCGDGDDIGGTAALAETAAGARAQNRLSEEAVMPLCV